MADLIADGVAWLEGQRKKFLSVEVEYRAVGAMFSRVVKATPGMTRWEGVDTAGQVVRMDTRAFFIAAADLPRAPQVGDRILLVENGRRATYEVIKPGLTDSPWQWSDRSQTVRRIHASLVSTD